MCSPGSFSVPSSAWSSPSRCGGDEDRHRRNAQRGQVDPVQRAHRRRGRDRRLSVHHGRAERGGRPGAGRAPRPGRRDAPLLRDRPGDDRLPRHRRPGQGGLAGGGARQPVPRLDPRDRRDLPRDPRPRRRLCGPSRGSGRSGGGRRADRDRAARRRPRVSRAAARAGTKLARSGEVEPSPSSVARAGGGGALRRPAGARGAGARGGARRPPQAVAADGEADPLRGQRRRGRDRGAAGAARPRGEDGGEGRGDLRPRRGRTARARR